MAAASSSESIDFRGARLAGQQQAAVARQPTDRALYKNVVAVELPRHIELRVAAHEPANGLRRQAPARRPLTRVVSSECLEFGGIDLLGGGRIAR